VMPYDVGDGADGPYAGFHKDLARWHAQTYTGVAAQHRRAARGLRRRRGPGDHAGRYQPLAPARYPWASWPAACSCCAAGCLPAAFDAFVRSQFPFPNPQTDPDRPRPQGART